MESKYSVVIRWSDEENAFIASHPELPGCMAAGETREEALALLNQFREGWIEMAKENGVAVPRPILEGDGTDKFIVGYSKSFKMVITGKDKKPTPSETVMFGLLNAWLPHTATGQNGGVN